jgi:hypothetical protein
VNTPAAIAQAIADAINVEFEDITAIRSYSPDIDLKALTGMGVFVTPHDMTADMANRKDVYEDYETLVIIAQQVSPVDGDQGANFAANLNTQDAVVNVAEQIKDFLKGFEPVIAEGTASWTGFAWVPVVSSYLETHDAIVSGITIKHKVLN